MVQSWVLVADIGGTNARFMAIPADNPFDSPQVDPLIIPTDQTPVFEDTLCAVIPQLGPPDHLVGVILALAAPVNSDIFKLTNADWIFDKAKIAAACGVQCVQFRNDFEAQAMALPYIKADGLMPLHGVPQAALAGNYVVVGPGTGLGVAGLVKQGDGSFVISGEGGHMTYAPETEIEWAISQGLKALYGRVSYERVLSGQGLVDVSRILGANSIETPENVTAAAIHGTCPYCTQAIHVFLKALGRVSGDVALAMGGASGVFIGGGIVPKIVNHFGYSLLVEAFLDKGRYVEHMKRVPFALITHKNPAFLGLMACAKDLLQHTKV